MTINSHDRDDFAPEAAKKRRGTIKITDTETGEVTYSRTYAAEDVLRLLSAGHDPSVVCDMLDKEDAC